MNIYNRALQLAVHKSKAADFRIKKKKFLQEVIHLFTEPITCDNCASEVHLFMFSHWANRKQGDMCAHSDLMGWRHLGRAIHSRTLDHHHEPQLTKHSDSSVTPHKHYPNQIFHDVITFSCLILWDTWTSCSINTSTLCMNTKVSLDGSIVVKSRYRVIR